MLPVLEECSSRDVLTEFEGIAVDADNFRSPELMTTQNTGLLVVDVQEKLLPVIENHAQIQANVEKLLDAAAILEVPVFVSEQYPKGLGATVPEIVQLNKRFESISRQCGYMRC